MNLEYAAGFFDGEGCIHIARNIRVILAGCFRPGLLEKFSERWGGKVTFQRTSRPKQRQGVRWELTGRKAASFLEDLLPFLYEKREQAILGIKYQERKRELNIRGGRGYTGTRRMTIMRHTRRT